MRKISRSLAVSALVLCVAVAASAQSRATKRVASTTTAPSTAPSLASFSFSTPHEAWQLGDPEPLDKVLFDGKPMPTNFRKIRETTESGAKQLFFPIAGYIMYGDENPDIKYVAAKYENGRLAAIFIQYQPGKLVMPRDGFKPMADGKSFYKTLTYVQQGDRFYVKQATSSGADDGHGELVVDTIAIYTAPVPAKTGK